MPARVNNIAKIRDGLDPLRCVTLVFAICSVPLNTRLFYVHSLSSALKHPNIILLHVGWVKFSTVSLS